MLYNNNLKVSWALVRRDFRFHRAKNALLILAAALVTALYTFVFLLGNAVQSGFLLSYQYLYGSTSHILYTGLTESQAALLSQHVNVKSAVTLSTIGTLSDPVLGQRTVQLAVTDRDYAETVLSLPSAGRLPEEPYEIALDEYTMGSLGLPYELGTAFPLQWTDAAGETHTDTFTLCGWWMSAANFTEACAWITADTASALFPGYDGETAKNVTLGLTLHQPRELEAQAAEILRDQGLPDSIPYTTNLAYNEARREQAVSQAARFYAPAVLVVVCGFLMIYGIVHVSADSDRAFFAVLKAQGMTPRQIRRMLLEKGCVVTGMGLLPGFLAGFFINLFVTGRVVTGTEVNPGLYFLDWPPFLAAAGCTLLTVLLSYLLPLIPLTRQTPAETMRLSAPAKAGRGSAGGLMTLPRLARRTISRGKGQLCLSVGVMLLAALLLNTVWMEYKSFQEDIYLAALSPWDYSVVDGSAQTSSQRYNEASRSITDETAETFRARPEVTSLSALKSREVEMTAPETLRKRVVDYYNQPYDDSMTLKESQAAFPDWIAGLDRLTGTGEYTAVVIGLEGDYLQYILDNCPFTSGFFDEAAFLSGDYILAGGAYNEGVSCPAAGETVELEGQTFTVMGSLMHDNAYLSGQNSREASFTFYYILPLPAFDALYPDSLVRQMAINIDPAGQGSFEAFLSDFESGLNRGIGVTLRSDYQRNFRDASLNTVLVPLIIGLVLAGIALLGFVNLLITRSVSRKRAFAVFQSLGMTIAQLRQLILLEGVLYALIMAAVLVPVSVAAAVIVMPGVIAELSWISVYEFTLLPLWVLLPVILILSVAVPLACLNRVTRGTLQERLRTAE